MPPDRRRNVRKMGNYTMEQKLRLVNQVRSRYDQDQSDLLRREQLLYGKTSNRTFDLEPEGAFPEAETENPAGVSFFRLRLLAALVVFVLILTLDRNGKDLFGMSTEQIFQSIAKDYVTELGNGIP